MDSFLLEFLRIPLKILKATMHLHRSVTQLQPLKKSSIAKFGSSALYIRDGRGSYFFHGAGQGGARPKIYGARRGREPPPSHSAGQGGEGVKSAGRGGAGAGNILSVSAN